jgi:hypothetical protein
MLSNHNRFVRDVAFSPNGDLFASCASDGKLIFYDGKSGELKGEAERNDTSSLVCCNAERGLMTDGMFMGSRLVKDCYRRCRRCSCHLYVFPQSLADSRGRFHLQVYPDIQCWIRHSISAKRYRLCQSQHHRLRLPLWCLERIRYPRIIQLKMENPPRAYQSHYRFHPVRVDILRRFIRWNHEELLCGIWG